MKEAPRKRTSRESPVWQPAPRKVEVVTKKVAARPEREEGEESEQERQSASSEGDSMSEITSDDEEEEDSPLPMKPTGRREPELSTREGRQVAPSNKGGSTRTVGYMMSDMSTMYTFTLETLRKADKEFKKDNPMGRRSPPNNSLQRCRRTSSRTSTTSWRPGLLTRAY